MAMVYGCLANDGITVSVGAVELESEAIVLNQVDAPPRGIEGEMEHATLRTPKDSGFLERRCLGEHAGGGTVKRVNDETNDNS
jgi:hypothetical protein